MKITRDGDIQNTFKSWIPVRAKQEFLVRKEAKVAEIFEYKTKFR